METDKIMAVVNQITVSKEHNNLEVSLKQSVVGEENLFRQALQQNPINKSTVEDLKQVLRLLLIKVGLREKNLPDEVEKAVLIEHIITNYGNHTPAEIKLAFDMGLAGKLEDVNGKSEPIDLDMNCYENFTCLYFSKVMNAYRRWARQTYNQLKMEQSLQVEEMETIDVVEMIERWRVDPNLNMLLIPLFFYSFLKETEIIKINDEQKWEWWRKAKESIKSELLASIPECKTNDALNEWKAFEKCEQTKYWDSVVFGKISNRAKRMIVYDYLKK